MQKAPDFTLLDQAGTSHTLADYKGSWLILYFYPQDDTPGCTAEACAFRDDYAVLQSKGLQIVGISKDTVDSHAKFAQKYHLNFALLSDKDRKVSESYGAKGLLGVKRMTFLINPSGDIAKTYPKVIPREHSNQILQDFEAMS